MPHTCDGYSVGVIITDNRLRVSYAIKRSDGAGWAPVAGHVFDEHSSFEGAAHNETREESGMRITRLTPIAFGGQDGLWLPNLCGAEVPATPPGHEWHLFEAEADGDGQGFDPREVEEAGWFGDDWFAERAKWTCDWATGRISRADWVRRGVGLEPPWVVLFSRIGRIRISTGDEQAVLKLCQVRPDKR